MFMISKPNSIASIGEPTRANTGKARNALANPSLLVREFLFVLYEFFLFPRLKRPMKGRYFDTIGEIKIKSLKKLKDIPKNVSRFGKNAEVSVSYSSGTTLN